MQYLAVAQALDHLTWLVAELTAATCRLPPDSGRTMPKASPEDSNRKRFFNSTASITIFQLV